GLLPPGAVGHRRPVARHGFGPLPLRKPRDREATRAAARPAGDPGYCHHHPPSTQTTRRTHHRSSARPPRYVYSSFAGERQSRDLSAKFGWRPLGEPRGLQAGGGGTAAPRRLPSEPARQPSRLIEPLAANPVHPHRRRYRPLPPPPPPPRRQSLEKQRQQQRRRLR
ncbi:unnamed protein product, partial [Ectocarpus fasciculatus]